MAARKLLSSLHALVLACVLAFGPNTASCQSGGDGVPAEFVGIWEGSIILDFESWDALLSIVGGSSSNDAPIATLALDAGFSLCTYYLSMRGSSRVSDDEGSILLAETRSRLAVNNERDCPRGTFKITKGPSESLVIDAAWSGGDSQSTTLIRIDEGSSGKDCLLSETSNQKESRKARAGKNPVPMDFNLLGIWEGFIQMNFDSWSSELMMVGGSGDMPVATMVVQSIDHVCVHVLEIDPRTENSTVMLMKTKYFWIRHLDHDCEPAVFKLEYSEAEKMNVEWVDTATGKGLGYPPKSMVRVDDGTTTKVCADKEKRLEKARKKKGSSRATNAG